MRRALIPGLLLVVLVLSVFTWWQNRPSHSPGAADRSENQIPEKGIIRPSFNTPPVPAAPTNAGPASPVAVIPPNADAVTAFTTFSNWVSRYLAGGPSAGSARGEALAWKRRQAMLQAMESDPARALSLAVPFEWRLALPADVTRHFERWVDGRGALEVAMAEDFDTHHTQVYRWAAIGDQRYRVFVYGRRQTQVSNTNLPLHGIALDGTLALTCEPLRVLNPAEAGALEQQRGRRASRRCAVCNRILDARTPILIADVGGETACFCGEEHLELANQNWILAEANGGSGLQANLEAGGGGTWTQGRKALLYMRVNFPDDLTEPNSEAAAYDTMDAVNAFYVKGSYNTTWLTTTVTPLLTVPRIKRWYSTAGPGALLSDARTVARKAGFDTDNYDLDIVSHTMVPGFTWGGLGAVHGKGTWLQSHGAGVTAHELGHNYGLLHANFWDTLAYEASAIGPGTNVEYGNIFDTMGAAVAGNNDFGALFKNALGWLPDTSVHSVTTNGTYRIHPFDVAERANGRFYAARIRKDYDRDYWLEFRSRFSGNPWFQNGLLLNWSPWTATGGTSLIDATPWTPGLDDSPLVIGRTLSDRVAGVHITPVARGGTGQDAWIDAQITVGDDAPNQPPFVRVQLDPTNAVPGEPVYFHADVIDADDETFAYSWAFDDGTVSTNNQAWTSRSWTQPGEHVVRCTVSDMRGGTTSANVVATVGEASGFRMSGLVLDDTGDPVEGVRVDNGIGTTPTYFSSLTDSEGRFVLTDVNDVLILEATKYGFAFTHPSWENPIVPVSNFANLNFVAWSLTNVSLAVTTNVISENGGSAPQLTLTRSGSLDEDLTVELYVSGSATVGGDLAFTPPLVQDLNEVIIPAGTNRLIYTLTPVNDSLVEAVETATVTVLEDPRYVITPLAEARITILDDDQPAKPEVSIGALVDFVPERGFDNMVFVVNRTGSTAGDLPVYYSAGGTATAGTDYQTLMGVVIVPAGSSSARIEFRPLDDKDVEPDESVTVSLSPNPTYTITGEPATAEIIDDDLLVVTISPTISGAAEPSSQGRFTVKRDGDQTAGLVVYYTVGGTASNGVDYVSPSGALTIPAGEASGAIWVTPLDDGLTEGDESVTVTLTPNPGYDVGIAGEATFFIRDDEKVTVSVTASDGTASEPGSDLGSFTFSRGPVTSGALTIDLAISGTAIPGADYVPLSSTVVIPDGASSVVLDVIPFDDLHIEPVEDVMITLLASTNYNLGAGQARMTINDDDFIAPAVGFTSAGSEAPESESPGLSVGLSMTSSIPITVDYTVIGGTASGADYALTPGTLTFDPGDWAKSIPLAITEENEVEPDETVVVALFDPANATLDGIKIHTYTIVDDDSSSVSVAATEPNASETGPASGNFRITRTGGTNNSLQVNFQLTGTASAPSDFAPLGSTITIPAGVAFVDLTVDPVDDNAVELDETVVLTLTSAAVGKVVSPHQATITITDDDPDNLPVVTLTTTNQPNAVEGGGNGAFEFTRQGSTNDALTLSVSYSGTAGMGADYATQPDSVIIPPGQLSVVLPVIATDDSEIEGEETVIAALTVGGTYRVSHAGSAMVTIQDNDQNVHVDASDFVAAEPGTDLGGFTFTRFGTTNTDLHVFFTLTGSALNGVDYATISNSFTIPAGSLTATLPVIPLDDPLPEGAEQVTLSIQGNPAYALASPTNATVTILDDEPLLSLTLNTTNVTEGSQEPAVLTVLRGGDPDGELTAHLTFGGTAEYGADYPPLETNVFFGCGIVAIDLPVYPTNELSVEGDETIAAAIVPDPAYSILPPGDALLTITDAGTNLAPIVTLLSPSADRIFLLGTNVNILLESSVTDDTGTNPPLTLTWSKRSGPETFSLDDTDPTHTTASFAEGGVYALRLVADDGQLSAFADVTVVVDTLVRLSNNIVHWTFDEGSGTNVTDVSGNGHDGIINGSADWVTNGVLGGALDLDGMNSVVREAAESGFLNARKQFSLSFWLKAEATNSSVGILSANDAGPDPTLTLAARPAASCGSGVNVLEGTLATPWDSARHLSASNVFGTDWQHVALTWSNSLEPSLYLNGALDQPGRHKVPLHGFLVNCPQFVLGGGPADIPGTWNGWVDDLRVFPRALDPAEVAGLVATNYGAIVVVPTNVVVPVLTPVELAGLVVDDGRPPPGVVTTAWSQVSGPLPVTIPNPQELTNTVEFSQSGDYVFRLIADDGQVKVFRDLQVTVVEPTQVYAFASDPFAAELGPDPGEFALYRYGDLNFALTVLIRLGGTASNGVDVVSIPQSDAVTFSNGVDYVTLPITPFLDHRIEGDETLTLTVLSNLTYTIVSGEASVLIQDSPYGMWSVEQFTLEELTDPTLSGEAADFDHDGLVNFVEYAANRDPKSPETNAPLRTAVELNPGDGLNHITLTYQRRLAPTDVAYEVNVSNDMITWHAGAGYVEEVQAIYDGNGLTETVTARLVAPWPSEMNQFITVRVWLLATGP